jgi:hypothetical protein
MGQANADRDERPGPPPEPFEVFYLREYPQVVGLLCGLLGSRPVAEELAQETLLVAYRDWDRISSLDNPAGLGPQGGDQPAKLVPARLPAPADKRTRRGCSGRGRQYQARR